MKIGELRDPVTFSRKNRTTDGMGGWTTTTSTIATAWAKVKVPASRDGVIADASAETRSHVVTVRQNTDTLGVRINDTVLWRSWTLVVKACRPFGMEYIDFDCRVELP